MKTTPTWSANITPVLILLGMLLLPMASNAQTTFQKVFGENTYTEIGRFGVKPVTGTCQTCKSSTGSTVSGGYIATGTSTWDQNNGNPGDIYIVRTDNNGNKIWENTYDVNGANGADAGNSIIEITDGSGFVVVGSTDLGTGNLDIVLMKVDCDGAVVWTRTYGGTGEEVGMDLIETRYGTAPSPFIPSAPGDIIVCGWSTSANTFGWEDGYLMRVTPLGGVIWGSALNSSSSGRARLISLAEPQLSYTPVGFSFVALEDVVAVGTIDMQDGSGNLGQGYVVRVNANTGTQTVPAFHGGGIYGNCITTAAGQSGCTAVDRICGSEVFTSICDLPSNNPYVAGDMVVAGFTTAYQPKDIYMLRIASGIPWTPAQQTIMGDARYCGQYVDYAWSVRQIPAGVSSGLTNYVAVTGATNKDNTNSDLDAFLLVLNPYTFQFGTMKKRYGKSDTATDNEEGISISSVTSTGNQGFVIAGMSQSNAEGASPADPQDLYLIKTDTNGSSGGCDDSYGAERTDISWNPVSTLGVTSVTWSANRPTSGQDHDWGDPACSGAGKIALPPTEGIMQESSAPGTIRSFPNPLHRGSVLHLSAPSLATDSTTSMQVSIANAVGEVVSTATMQWSSTGMDIPTNHLNAGSYVVAVSNGTTKQSIRIVIVE